MACMSARKIIGTNILKITVISGSGVCSELRTESSFPPEMRREDEILGVGPGEAQDLVVTNGDNVTQPTMHRSKAKTCTTLHSNDLVPYIVFNDGSVGLQHLEEYLPQFTAIQYQPLLGFIKDKYGAVLDVKQVSSLKGYSIILTEEGYLYAYGTHANWILDITDPAPIPTPTKICTCKMAPITKFALTTEALLMLTTDGCLYSKKLPHEDTFEMYVTTCDFIAERGATTHEALARLNALQLTVYHNHVVPPQELGTFIKDKHDKIILTNISPVVKFAHYVSGNSTRLINITSIPETCRVITSYEDGQSYVTMADGDSLPPENVMSIGRAREEITLPIVSVCGKHDNLLVLDSMGKLWLLYIRGDGVITNAKGLSHLPRMIAISHAPWSYRSWFACDQEGKVIAICDDDMQYDRGPLISEIGYFPLRGKLTKRSLQEACLDVGDSLEMQPNKRKL